MMHNQQNIKITVTIRAPGTLTNTVLYTESFEGKAKPVQAWIGTEGSRSFRLPNFKAISTQR
jgi:hypothetical protein